MSYEEKINDLQVNLASCQKKLDQAVAQANSKTELKHLEIDQSLETQASALKIVKNLETEVLKLQKRLQETVQDKNMLEKQLEDRQHVIKGRVSGYRMRVHSAGIWY